MARTSALIAALYQEDPRQGARLALKVGLAATKRAEANLAGLLADPVLRRGIQNTTNITRLQTILRQFNAASAQLLQIEATLVGPEKSNS